jgi:hypothetical protein
MSNVTSNPVLVESFYVQLAPTAVSQGRILRLHRTDLLRVGIHDYLSSTLDDLPQW